MARLSNGWQSALKVVETSDGLVRVSAHVQAGGARAGWPRFVAQLGDGTWAAVQLDASGAMVGLVRNQPSRDAALHGMEDALGAGEPGPRQAEAGLDHRGGPERQ